MQPTKTTYRIAVIAGDGIGKEVMPEGMRVLNAAANKYGFKFEWDEFPWSCEYYEKTGSMMPANGLEQVRDHDAIYLGAVVRSIEAVLEDGPRTPDMGGTATTVEVGEAIVTALSKQEDHQAA